MNEKQISRFRSSLNLRWISIFLIFILIQSGCTDNKNGESVIETRSLTKSDSSAKLPWVDVLIKFKPNTTSEMRDFSIRAIKKLIMDSVTIMRKGSFSGFDPIFVVSNSEISDPLTYGFKVVATANTAAPIKDTACTCAHGCGVCAMLTRSLITLPPDTASSKPSPFQNISAIIDPE
jgi:hypothetical protein